MENQLYGSYGGENAEPAFIWQLGSGAGKAENQQPGDDEFMKKQQARICVYTRPVQADCYPEGLANSVHISCETEEGVVRPFRKNGGILFAEGRISPENTIIPLGVTCPGIFRMANGMIGITGKRIHEDGRPDEAAGERRLLWTTGDLIHFEFAGLVTPGGAIPENPSDNLLLDRETAEAALRWWCPITHTGTVVPEVVPVRRAQDLDHVRAILTYSDGSRREKKITWQTADLPFDRPGLYPVKGIVRQQRFSFPLAKGYGDPVLFPWKGKWYYTSTNDNRDDIGLYVREGDTVEDLFSEGVREHLILPFSPERGFEQTFWAPEFHVIGGALYLLFAVSGHVWGPQCHLMKKKKGGRITDPEAWENPIRVTKKDGSFLAEDAITLDMTFVRAQSGSYVIWSYREHIGTPLDSGSMLYIASIDEQKPWQLTSDPVLLTRPLYGWENVSGTINNEGPHAFVKNGTVHVTYSGGSANRYTYALGLLTADASDNLLDPRAWHKSISPVLTFLSVEGEYGPGHNSFFTNEEGELMIAYHAETSLSDTLRCDGIRRVHFRQDQTPYFGMGIQDEPGSVLVETKAAIGGEEKHGI